MKKTFIMLLAMAGVASAAEPFAEFFVVGDGSHNNDTGWNGGPPTQLVVGTKDAETSEITALGTAQTWAHVGCVTFDSNAGTMTTDGTGTVQYLNKNQSGITLNSMSYSFDASWTQNESGTSYFTALGEDGNSTYSFRIGIIDNKWTITSEGYGAMTLTTQGVAAASGSGTYIITSESVDGVQTINMYEDNILVLSGSRDGQYGQPGNFKIGIGGCFGTTANAMSATFSNVTLYNQVIPVEAPVVPEPATATLSLLALAGLAARRRRK